MAKAPDAFRTISEVADWLGIQAHVLRFWESKFTQVKPIKRAGGRRYYRPGDMLLLGGIKQLLHDDGITIKGVQKILREEGIGHVSALSIPIDGGDMIEGKALRQAETTRDENVVPMERAPKDDIKDAVEPAVIEAEIASDAAAKAATNQGEPPEVAGETAPQEQDPAALPSFLRRAPEAAPEPRDQSDNMPSAAAAAETVEQVEATNDEIVDVPTETPPLSDEQEAQSADQQADAAEQAPVDPPAPKPANISIPAFTPEADFDASPAALSAAARLRKLTRPQADSIAPSLKRLAALRDQMAQTPQAATKG